MKRVGLLGGAFNPPHQGHLRLAHLALEALSLDELRFVPTALSPHKPDPGGSLPDARMRLLKEALSDFDPRCGVEPLELERGGISYTVDTLEALTQREPDSRWILIMGSDQLQGMPSWHRFHRILELASVATALRPGFALPQPRIPGLAEVQVWSGLPGELVCLPSTDLDLASSHLRSRLQAAPEQDPGGLHGRVLGTIRSENLYR